MKTEVKTIYTCDYCKKTYFRKHACEKHELWCNSNPKNKKACSGCVNLIKVEINVENNHPEYASTFLFFDAFKCTVFDKLLYPTIVQRKGLLDRYPETFEDQEPMPTECDKKKVAFLNYSESLNYDTL